MVDFHVDKFSIANYPIGIKALYINNAFLKMNKNIVVVTEMLEEALLLYNALTSISSDVIIFPENDYLYSSKNNNFLSEQLTALDLYSENESKIIVTNSLGFLKKIVSREDYKKDKIEIVKDKEINLSEVINKLISFGYSKEITLSDKGEFSVRGFIVDIFPFNSDLPIRIELFDDLVLDIRTFDIDTQFSVDKMELYSIVGLSDDSSTNSTILTYKDDTLLFFNERTMILNKLSQKEQNENYYDLDEINLDGSYDFTSIGTTNNSSYELLDFNEKGNELLDLVSKETSNIVICFRDHDLISRYKLIDGDFFETDIFNLKKGINNLIVFDITSSFRFNDFTFISYKDLLNFEDLNIKSFKTYRKIGEVIKLTADIKSGDYVVHYSHGIAKYLGIKTIINNNVKQDYLELEYKNNDKLYVPASKIELITKYSDGTGGVPKIHRLDGTDWAKTKYRVNSKIKEMAINLVELYKERQEIKGYSFLPDDLEKKFSLDFPYILTNDQINSIDEILLDMESTVPMDRLLCGDVGFGKTEVAFRAIFRAIINNKQVVLLCPTTMLASQHFKTAIKRFRSFPINIGVLSRLTSDKDTTKYLKELKEGHLDLVIGTHRLLSNDVKFRDLGLIVVDEEQRFGVEQKELLKNMSRDVDVLTLTATPIPRTLQMSYMGIRDLSIIETPPINRYPIQTFIIEEDWELIKSSILKEKERKGQVFILNNDINRGFEMTSKLRKLLPGIIVHQANGQMSKTVVDDIMTRFYNNEIDVLVATTIIETGIDIPNANTLIVIDADLFGLSQLYQIRGRVGRSDRLAYCYLMYKKNKILTEDGYKRLAAIKDYTALGSGIKIAMRDLSIRGAGSILGKEQAGFINDVGIDLFMELLDEESRRIKGEKVPSRDSFEDTPVIQVNTTISSDYELDETMKLEVHKIINSIDDFNDIPKVKESLKDLLGSIDEDLEIYMYNEWLTKLTSELSIKGIKDKPKTVEVELGKNTLIDVDGRELFFSITDLGDVYSFKTTGSKNLIILDKSLFVRHKVFYLLDLFNLIKKLRLPS